jgi:hypothetical protein
LLAALLDLRRKRKEALLADGKNELPATEWIFPNQDGGFQDMKNLKKSALSKVPGESWTATDPVPRSEAHIRVIASSERGVADIRQRTTRAFQHQDHRGHLRASGPWGESAGGEPVTDAR